MVMSYPSPSTASQGDAPFFVCHLLIDRTRDGAQTMRRAAVTALPPTYPGLYDAVKLRRAEIANAGHAFAQQPGFSPLARTGRFRKA
jgi:hypothetical protein